jgi:hypothetical protein
VKDSYEAAEERFFIMASEPDVDDITACKIIQAKYGRYIAVRIWKKYCEGKNETKKS